MMENKMITLDQVKDRFYQEWEGSRELGPACSATLFELVNQDQIDRLDLFCYFLLGRTASIPDLDAAWETVKPEVITCIDKMRLSGVPEISEAANFYNQVIEK